MNIGTTHQIGDLPVLGTHHPSASLPYVVYADGSRSYMQGPLAGVRFTGWEFSQAAASLARGEKLMPSEIRKMAAAMFPSAPTQTPSSPQAPPRPQSQEDYERRRKWIAEILDRGRDYDDDLDDWGDDYGASVKIVEPEPKTRPLFRVANGNVPWREVQAARVYACKTAAVYGAPEPDVQFFTSKPWMWNASEQFATEPVSTHTLGFVYLGGPHVVHLEAGQTPPSAGHSAIHETCHLANSDMPHDEVYDTAAALHRQWASYDERRYCGQCGG